MVSVMSASCYVTSQSHYQSSPLNVHPGSNSTALSKAVLTGPNILITTACSVNSYIFYQRVMVCTLQRKFKINVMTLSQTIRSNIFRIIMSFFFHSFYGGCSYLAQGCLKEC